MNALERTIQFVEFYSRGMGRLDFIDELKLMASRLSAPSADVEKVKAALYEFKSYVPEFFAKKWKHDEQMKEALAALDRLAEKKEKEDDHRP